MFLRSKLTMVMGLFFLFASAATIAYSRPVEVTLDYEKSEYLENHVFDLKEDLMIQHPGFEGEDLRLADVVVLVKTPRKSWVQVRMGEDHSNWRSFRGYQQAYESDSDWSFRTVRINIPLHVEQDEVQWALATHGPTKVWKVVLRFFPKRPDFPEEPGHPSDPSEPCDPEEPSDPEAPSEPEENRY